MATRYPALPRETPTKSGNTGGRLDAPGRGRARDRPIARNTPLRPLRQQVVFAPSLNALRRMVWGDLFGDFGNKMISLPNGEAYVLLPLRINAPFRKTAPLPLSLSTVFFCAPRPLAIRTKKGASVKIETKGNDLSGKTRDATNCRRNITRTN